ncbi:MAG: amylo-alpha-1,6-glucosidase, partial [Candidatus Omnitrophota bacterium]
AYLKVHGKNKKNIDDMKALLKPFEAHLQNAGLGCISEIFDGDVPYRPNGCISQAWSVAELLRVMHEDLGMFSIKHMGDVAKSGKEIKL